LWQIVVSSLQVHYYHSLHFIIRIW